MDRDLLSVIFTYLRSGNLFIIKQVSQLFKKSADKELSRRGLQNVPRLMSAEATWMESHASGVFIDYRSKIVDHFLVNDRNVVDLRSKQKIELEGVSLCKLHKFYFHVDEKTYFVYDQNLKFVSKHKRKPGQAVFPGEPYTCIDIPANHKWIPNELEKSIAIYNTPVLSVVYVSERNISTRYYISTTKNLILKRSSFVGCKLFLQYRDRVEIVDVKTFEKVTIAVLYLGKFVTLFESYYYFYNGEKITIIDLQNKRFQQVENCGRPQYKSGIIYGLDKSCTRIYVIFNMKLRYIKLWTPIAYVYLEKTIFSLYERGHEHRLLLF